MIVFTKTADQSLVILLKRLSHQQHLFNRLPEKETLLNFTIVLRKSRFEGSRYDNTRQVVEDIENRERISLERFEFRGDIKLQKMFLELSAQLEYKIDCYESNKYVHFKRLLVERGFEDIIKEHIPTVKKK